MVTSSVTGPASASARRSTSSSSTRAPTSGSATPSPRATCPTSGFTRPGRTYAEGIYVEHMWGKADALKYLNGYASKVRNREPIVAPRGVNRVPPQDMYFKGALFINTLRSVVDDDERWWRMVREFYDRFKYQNITTERRRRVLQQGDRQRPDADLQPVPAAHGASRPRVEVPGRRRVGVLPLEGGRARFRDAGEGWARRPVARPSGRPPSGRRCPGASREATSTSPPASTTSPSTGSKGRRGQTPIPAASEWGQTLSESGAGHAGAGLARSHRPLPDISAMSV